MKRFGVLALAASLALLLAPPIAAQELVPGTWTGAMMPPDGGEVPLTYTVAHTDGALAITLVAPMGEFPFREIGFDNGALTFVLTPGTRLECALDPQEDGSYYGDCVDEEGDTGQMRMIPPAAEG